MYTHERRDIAVSVERNGPQRIAATVHWPGGLAPDARPPVLVCFPGAGYNRRYFDLPDAGYSQAAHHVAAGMIVIAVDHLAVGESSVPPPEHAGLDDVAAANAHAVARLLAQVRAGLPDGPAFSEAGPVIGIGQSMGGHIVVTMQARHRCFDGVAVLGSSMVHTRLPSTTPWRHVRFDADADPATAGMEAVRMTDWRVAYHWEDVPQAVIDADMAGKLSAQGPAAPWTSLTHPDAGKLMLPAAVSREAAAIDVPVLVAMGERDVCQDSLRELAAFPSCRDLALFQVPRMAHMHNFAGTRERMWIRLEAFARQVAVLRG